MRASLNKNSSLYGQVIESQIILDGDLACDMQTKYLVFKNTTTGENLLRLKQVSNQLYYNVYTDDWSEDIVLTLSDPEQLKNLPQEPIRTNANTYARMDSDFKLYDHGSQYIRIANNPPTIYVSSAVNF